MEFVVVIAVAAALALVGIVVGLRLAPRIDRWQQEREGSDDDAK